MSTAPATDYCWHRPRVIVSWLCTLAFLLTIFRPGAGLLPFLLMVFMPMRPALPEDAMHRLRLAGAIGCLVAVPLLAVVSGSTAILAFLATPRGILALIVFWLILVCFDIRFYYRFLPPFRERRTLPPANPI